MTAPRRAAILAIGDEITLGQKTDTNSAEIANRLTDRAVQVTEHTAVADDTDAIAATFRRLAQTNDIIISTGGLGPTPDDLTRQALARATDDKLIEDDRALTRLQQWADSRKRELSTNQRLQALRPTRAESLDNDHGTAPALLATLANTTIACLPGPPREMRPILEAFLNTHAPERDDHVIRTRIVRVPALAEAEAAAKLAELMDRARNPLVGTTASGALVDVRIRYEGDAQRADTELNITEQAVRVALDPFALPPESPSLPHSIVQLLRERTAVLSTAESCTGGGIARRITDISGSSDIYSGGWVTYSNEMKQRELGVPSHILDTHGAVSEQTARAMAIGVLDHNPDATISLSVTGIAGPGGGSEDKPIGTVYIGCAHRRSTPEPDCSVKRFLFPGDRTSVRAFSTNVALAMLRFELLGITPGRLLAEVPPQASS